MKQMMMNLLVATAAAACGTFGTAAAGTIAARTVAARTLGTAVSLSRGPEHYYTGLVIPESFDQNDYNQVFYVSSLAQGNTTADPPLVSDYTAFMPAIKNQQQCGSCYAFASLTVVEGQRNLKAGGPVQEPLSEGQVIDCSYIYGNRRCGGGMPLSVFAYLKQAGVCPLREYPYYIPFEFCQRNACAQEEKTYVKDYGLVQCATHADLARALHERGPLAVAIDATNLHLYKGRLFTGCPRSPRLNHAVALVGLVEYDGELAWKIQNSWGADFGEGGFFYIPYDTAEDCGLLQFVAFAETP
jgi:C1A family cysteine protease